MFAKTLLFYAKRGPVIALGDLNGGTDTTFRGKKLYDFNQMVWGPLDSQIRDDFTNLKLMDAKGNPLPTWLDKDNPSTPGNPLVTKTTVPVFLLNLGTPEAPGSWDTHSSQLDHIFISSQSIKAHGPAERVFDQAVRLPRKTHRCRFVDYDGRTPLSDHYGISALLEVLSTP